MTARAANVSHQIRQAGYGVVNSTTRWDSGSTGVRVTQSGDKVRVQVRSNQAALTAAQISQDLRDLGYEVDHRPGTDLFYEALWVSKVGKG